MKNARYLFSNWESIKKTIGNRFIYLFLDYDGTLSPLSQVPGKAIMSERVKEVLSKLSNMSNCKIAIVSGRAVNDISKRVGLKKIVYVGNHGFEIRGPKINFKSPISRRFRNILEEIISKLKKNLLSFKGVLIEDKGFSITVHYRLADKKDIAAIESEFYASLFLYEFRNNVQIKAGKMALEVRPPIPWNKGLVVLWLLGRRLFAMRDKKENVIPIYVGDDITDEDAFESLIDKGITIFVGSPKNTKARFYLKDTGEVTKFLELILNNRNSGSI